jgi:sulfate adenylyltransferase
VSTIPSQRARDLLVDDSRRDELRRLSIDWPSWAVASDALIDLEALLGGWLAPCAGYVIPGAPTECPAAPTLQVSNDVAERTQPGTIVALRDPEGVLLAALHVEQQREVDGHWWLGGRVEGIERPSHDDFAVWRSTPGAIVERLAALERPHVAAFLPGAMLHAGTRHALLARAERPNAAIVVMIPSRFSGTGDALDVTRVRAMLASAQQLPADRFIIAVVPAVGHHEPDVVRAGTMAKSFGATDLLVDVTDASPDALEHAATITGIGMTGISSSAYDTAARPFVDPSERISGGIRLPPDTQPSGSDYRLAAPPAYSELLARPAATPRWLLTDAEIEAWQRACPPRDAQGFSVFLTGLSGSGKSTIARALRSRLLERTGRPVTLLDGDLVRRHLSSELGFSREHRDLNILRIGWVASEIVRHGGIAICAPIAPYDAIRRQVRQMIEPVGGFLLVHVATPLETCEARDRKGLYAKARAGLIPNFTGVNDPYEPPADAALVIDTRNTSVDAACDRILARLASDGYLVEAGSGRIERRS